MTTQGWFSTPIYVSQLEGGLLRNVQKELFEACDKIAVSYTHLKLPKKA